MQDKDYHPWEGDKGQKLLKDSVYVVNRSFVHVAPLVKRNEFAGLVDGEVSSPFL